MKLSIDRSTLLTALTRVSGIVGRRNVIPILSNVLLDAADDQLVIRATDLDLEARVAVTCRVSEPGAITTPAASLLDIAKATAEGAEISIALEGGRLKVNAGRARWKLPVLPAADFPAFDGEDWEWSGKLTGSALSGLLGRVAWAVHPTELAILGGIHISSDGENLRAMASDQKQMVIATAPCGGTSFVGVIISRRTAAEIARMSGEDGGALRLSSRRVAVETGGAMIRARVIVGRYPVEPIDKLANEPRAANITAPVAQFVAAVRRAQIGADTTYLKFDLSPGALSISSRSADSTEGADEIEVAYDGEPVILGINGAAFVEMLGSLKGEDAELGFGHDHGPISLRSPSDGSVVCASTLARV